MCCIKWEQIQERSISLSMPSAKVVNKSHQVPQSKKNQNKKMLWLDPAKQVTVNIAYNNNLY